MPDDGESGSFKIVLRAGHPGSKPKSSKTGLREARKQQRQSRKGGRK